MPPQARLYMRKAEHELQDGRTVTLAMVGCVGPAPSQPSFSVANGADTSIARQAVRQTLGSGMMLDSPKPRTS
eukprot:14363538-Alexandrium_andersonii.AAC.1